MTSPRELRPPRAPGRELVLGSLCTGYGGLDLGVLVALGGGRLAWVADPDPHVRAILAARLPGVPNLGDIATTDWRRVAPVEVLTAGFPCQDLSAAGRGAGIRKGPRSGLWHQVIAAVRQLRPALVVVENVAALRWRPGGLDVVLADLAEAGYDALWRSVRAADIGAAHRRERVFLLAWPRTLTDADAADTAGARRRSPGSSRPGPPPGGWASSQPARRGERSRQTAAHADGVRRQKLHAPDAAGWAVAARQGPAAADPASLGRRDRRASGGRGGPAAAVPAGAAAGGPRDIPADAAGDRRNKGLPGAARLQGRPDAALGDHPAASPAGGQRHLVAACDHPRRAGCASDGTGHAGVDWGIYTAAVHRWEHLLGRPAPHPTQPGQHGRPVLAPTFVEHLMGLPEGWVTDLPLPRTAQLRALGNGVVPQQAAYAVALLLADLAALIAEEHSGDRREANAA